MIYYILTIIDLAGSLASVFSLTCVARNYFLPPKVGTYILLTIASMIYLLFANAYNLDSPARDWKLPITSLLWCYKTLYFSWVIRDKGIRKY